MNKTQRRKRAEVVHGPNAFQDNVTAINRRAKEHPNSWRVKTSNNVKKGRV